MGTSDPKPSSLSSQKKERYALIGAILLLFGLAWWMYPRSPRSSQYAKAVAYQHKKKVNEGTMEAPSRMPIGALSARWERQRKFNEYEDMDIQINKNLS